MGKTAGKSGRPANTNRTPLILSPDRSRAEHAKYDCATQHLTQQLWSERENSTNPYGRAEEVMDLRVSRMRDYAWLGKSGANQSLEMVIAQLFELHGCSIFAQHLHAFVPGSYTANAIILQP